MFNQSYQQLTFNQQIIALNQTYPCPRCSCGIMEPYGHTETFRCSGCERVFVPLRGGRMLHPANRMGSKIAPTFWWDGLRWHFAGTTATANQIMTILVAFLLPLIALNLSLGLNLWHDRPEWCSPLLMTALIGLVTIQMIYFCCWDFDFLSKGRSRN
jgi:hypothetical protein